MLQFPHQSLKFLNPQKIVEQLALQSGMQVADFGCGAGDFVVCASGIVGAEGKVSAIDIQDSALSSAKSKARMEGVLNIDFIKADLETANSSNLSDGSQDAVLLTNILHQVGDKNAIMKECFRVLKNGGIAAVVDWKKDAVFGPIKDTRLSVEDVKQLAQKHNLTFQKEIDAGVYHFGMVFTKANYHV